MRLRFLYKNSFHLARTYALIFVLDIIFSQKRESEKCELRGLGNIRGNV